MNRLSLIVTAACIFILAGCDRKPAAPPAGGASGGAVTAPAASSEKPADDRSAPEGSAGHGGEIIELGTTKIGEWTVCASRDRGEIRAGGDAPIDVWLTTADGNPATVKAVRFWIGSEDAKGSVKAKADIEDPQQPNHWHTHAEVPSPIPDGVKLWVEIEATDGTKSSGSFELKP